MTDQGITLFESGVNITKRSLAIHGLDYDAWEQGYTKVVGVEECGPFWIGDYLNWGEATFGEQYSQVLDEDHAKTHLIYKYVCSRIAPERRRDELSFSIHREVCSIEDTATQDKILDVAEQDGLTVREVRELVKAAKGDVKPAVDWWGKFVKFISDMQKELPEDSYRAMVTKIRTYILDEPTEAS